MAWKMSPNKNSNELYGGIAESKDNPTDVLVSTQDDNEFVRVDIKRRSGAPWVFLTEEDVYDLMDLLESALEIIQDRREKAAIADSASENAS